MGYHQGSLTVATVQHRMIVALQVIAVCLWTVQAQTEGDIGYEYNEAYDEYDEESGVEPTFDVPIVNVTVVAGQTAVLPCSIDSLGKNKVAWLDQTGMPLTVDDRRVVDDIRFSVVRPYLKEWNLQILKIKWEDQGKYQCRINTTPGRSKSVVLHVKVPPQIIDEASSNDLTVQEGDTVVLWCNVTGVPQPEVVWYRSPASSKLDERESKMCKPRSVGPGIGHVGEVIIIHNVSRYCDDIYECVADNGVKPAVSRQMRVTVEFPPEVIMTNQRIAQELDKETILECIITAYPLATSYWMKNGQDIMSPNRHSKIKGTKYRVQPYDEGDHTITLSLRITNIKQEDFGEYRCYASNSLGTDVESMWLVEYQPPKISPEIVTVVVSGPNGKHPTTRTHEIPGKNDKEALGKELYYRNEGLHSAGESPHQLLPWLLLIVLLVNKLYMGTL